MGSDPKQNVAEKAKKDAVISAQMITMLHNIANDIENPLHKEVFEKLLSLYIDSSTQLKKVQEEIRTLSVTDPLTQIYNRMKLMDMLKYEIKRYARYPQGIVLVIIDIDNFKNVNEQHGVPIGDTVLKEFCELIIPNIRKHDTFARWSGQEFAILMPGISAENALARAEELRSKVARHVFTENIRITCSLGVSSYNPDENIDDILKRADTALSKSKESGKNKVSFGF